MTASYIISDTTGLDEHIELKLSQASQEPLTISKREHMIAYPYDHMIKWSFPKQSLAVGVLTVLY